MSLVFGPVPSRRLGRSLGIDPIPFKTCNWNCVYCQLGRTSPLTRERSRFHPVEAILAEVDGALQRLSTGDVDWITFVGSGEPTLHADLGTMIRAVKARAPWPVAVITNGSLLDDAGVRAELAAADAVLPSLDASSERQFLRINRPAAGASLAGLVDGLIAFRQEFAGKLWLEVMLIRGENDDETTLRGLADHIRRIRPDEVHLNLPIRPPAEAWIEPPDPEGMMRAIAILGSGAHPLALPAFDLELPPQASPAEAVADLVMRHPLRERDVVEALRRWPRPRVNAALAELAADDRIQRVERFGETFLAYRGARYREPRRRSQGAGRGCVGASPAGDESAPETKPCRERPS